MNTGDETYIHNGSKSMCFCSVNGVSVFGVCSASCFSSSLKSLRDDRSCLQLDATVNKLEQRPTMRSWCFDMQATPGPLLGVIHCFRQQLIAVAMITLSVLCILGA